MMRHNSETSKTASGVYREFNEMSAMMSIKKQIESDMVRN